jgi:hypothetical protein
MSRPLLVTDCDEVLLHMIVPFTNWLDEAHAIHFDVDNLFHGETGDYQNAMRYQSDGRQVEPEKIWPFLKGFFETEMHRQNPINGAVESIAMIAEHADIVVLTNLTDDARDARAEQLRAVGITAPVYTNQGGKGAVLAGIIADYNPSVTVFVDDLAQQHHSVAAEVPGVMQLHFVGEPRVAHQIKTPKVAHARIDDWPTAREWIIARLQGVSL